jgi:Elongation factor P, C-terminal
VLVALSGQLMLQTTAASYAQCQRLTLLLTDAAGGSKPAKLETGAMIEVPLFIKVRRYPR